MVSLGYMPSYLSHSLQRGAQSVFLSIQESVSQLITIRYMELNRYTDNVTKVFRGLTLLCQPRQPKANRERDAPR